MVERFYVAYFDDEHDLVHAAEVASKRGHRILDAFSPIPVHGLSEAMRLGPSRLSWIGLWAGILGLVLGVTMQDWTSAHDWPLVVGGQPFNSWPVFVPVSFELTVLFAGCIGVICLFLRSKLWPGRRAPLLRRVTNDRFALALTVADASADPVQLVQMLRECKAIQIVESDELAAAEGEAQRRGDFRSFWRSLAWCGVVMLPAVVLGGLWTTRRDMSKPNVILPTQMAYSTAYRAQSANPVFANHMTEQLPVEGTLPRGGHNFNFAPTDADRLRAGRELTNPFGPTSANLTQGKRVFDTFCLPCHGATGNGDGPIVPRFPNPPNFHSDASKNLTDGEMFHILTLGRNKMQSYASQVQWEDRWRAILYIRSLQKK